MLKFCKKNKIFFMIHSYIHGRDDLRGTDVDLFANNCFYALSATEEVLFSDIVIRCLNFFKSVYDLICNYFEKETTT